MPSRKVPFVNGEYYHIFNRGVAKMPIFYSSHDYNRFTKTMKYYMVEGPKPKLSSFMPTTLILSATRIVDIVCYCLMPNHFHFLLRQVREGGITEFVSKICNSYTKFINTKQKRVGPLLQGEFHSVHIESNNQLLHLSRYIHINPTVNFVVKNLDDYPWSSYNEYVNEEHYGFCQSSVVLEQFPDRKIYKQFLHDQEDYGKSLESIKHLLIDLED